MPCFDELLEFYSVDCLILYNFDVTTCENLTTNGS